MTSPQTKLAQLWAQFCKCESGATAIEYGLIAALISVVAIGAFRGSGLAIAENFNTAANEMQGAANN